MREGTKIMFLESDKHLRKAFNSLCSLYTDQEQLFSGVEKKLQEVE